MAHRDGGDSHKRERRDTHLHTQPDHPYLPTEAEPTSAEPKQCTRPSLLYFPGLRLFWSTQVQRLTMHAHTGQSTREKLPSKVQRKEFLEHPMEHVGEWMRKIISCHKEQII